MRRLRAVLSPALIISIIALVVAIAGSALAQNGGRAPGPAAAARKHHKKKSVLVRCAAATVRCTAPRGATGPAGPQGNQGPQGIRGSTGDKGEAGPSDTWAAPLPAGIGTASVSLPPGRYVAYGAVTFYNPSSGSTVGGGCAFTVTPGAGDSVNRADGTASRFTAPPLSDASTANSEVVDVTGPTNFTLSLGCGTYGSGQLTVTRVGTLH
jgi:hypothetical protein